MAALVLRRWRATRRSRWLEPAYAAAFVCFGLSDLREAAVLQGWLVAVKLVILGALIPLRREILRRHPTARAF